MKNYISISESAINKIVDKTGDTTIKLTEVLRSLQSVSSLIGLTEDEKNSIENTRKILIEKMEVLENILDDENNEFYNINNVDVE